MIAALIGALLLSLAELPLITHTGVGVNSGNPSNGDLDRDGDGKRASGPDKDAPLGVLVMSWSTSMVLPTPATTAQRSARRPAGPSTVSSAVLDRGDGPPVLCSAWPRRVRGSVRASDDLVTTHLVVTPDLPSHGATGLQDGPLDHDRVLP